LEWSRKVNRALAETGLTQVQFSLLAGAAYLNHRGGAPSQAELADHAGMDVMMTSQVMRSLESDRLVKRLADKNDARVKRIVPTANGVDVVAAAIKLVELLDDEVFGLIEDIDRFKEALRLVADRDLDGQRTSGE
jgi:DNA-binding MarR family transcriptional regulator